MLPRRFRRPARTGAGGLAGGLSTHDGYRAERMGRFRQLLQNHAIDGIWLDYHHAHSSWERADPIMPDTCFCGRGLRKFQEDTKIRLPRSPRLRTPRLLLTGRREWVRWRCAVFTDWVREFREIPRRHRPAPSLARFTIPGPTRILMVQLNKLAIDLKAQAASLTSSAPSYPRPFGHPTRSGVDLATGAWLGGIWSRGQAGERLRIWPIVQLSDWAKRFPRQVGDVLDHGSRLPATGTNRLCMGFPQEASRQRSKEWCVSSEVRLSS